MYHIIFTCFSLSCEYFNSITAIQVLLHILSLRCPRLELLSLRKTGTASAILHCPSLTKLDVSYCHKLSDAGVRAAAVACPLLASLNMESCAYVTDDTLREISLACAHLQTLDASYCPNISLEVSFSFISTVLDCKVDGPCLVALLVVTLWCLDLRGWFICALGNVSEEAMINLSKFWS